MRTANASVLEQFKAPLALRSFSVPAKPEPGAILVRTEMAGICGTDVHLWKGELPIKLPVILGHETVGRIEATRRWRGERLVGRTIARRRSRDVDAREPVAATVTIARRNESQLAAPIGAPTASRLQCDQAPHFLGGYADLHYLNPRTNVFKLPDDLPTESVIGAGCALNTALHGIERTAIGHRDIVVVQGAGPVGIAALACAKTAGASQVIVIGAPKHRLEMAKRFGADHVIDIDQVRTPAERIAAIRELTRGYGADAVLECVGAPPVVVEGMEMCRDGGKYLILGHYCDAGTTTWNPHVVTRKQLNVIGSWASEPRHMKMAIEFLRTTQKQFPFAEMVSHRFPLEKANEALATTASWQSAKSVIVPSLKSS